MFLSMSTMVKLRTVKRRRVVPRSPRLMWNCCLLQWTSWLVSRRERRVTSSRWKLAGSNGSSETLYATISYVLTYQQKQNNTTTITLNLGSTYLTVETHFRLYMMLENNMLLIYQIAEILKFFYYKLEQWKILWIVKTTHWPLQTPSIHTT